MSEGNKIPDLNAVRGEINASLNTFLPGGADYVDDTRGKVITADFFGLHPALTYTDPWRCGWVRLWDTFTSWRQLEPTTKGVFNWSARLAPLTATAAARGQKVLLTLGQAPNWATGGGYVSEHGGNYNNLATFTDQDWVDYITAVVNWSLNNPINGKRRIDAYEVWNEPNGTGFYNGSVERLVQLTRLAYQTIKALDPTALVVSPCPTSITGVDYLKSLFDAGMAPYIDVTAYHLYVYPDQPEAVMDRALHYRTVASAYAPEKPTWNTEFTYHGWTDSEGITHINSANNEVMADDQAADYIVRMFLACMIAGVEVNFIYGLKPAWNSLSLLRPDQSTVTPAGQAWLAFQNEMIGARIVSYSQPAAGVQMLTYIHSSGESRAWVWGTDRAAAAIPSDRVTQLTAQRVPSGSPVYTGTATQNATSTPKVFILGSKMLPFSSTGSGGGAGGGNVAVELLANTNFALRRTDGGQLMHWVGATTPYTGTDAPAGTYPATFTPAAQYQQLRQNPPQALVPGYRYRLSVTYKGGDSRHILSLEMGRVGLRPAAGAEILLSPRDSFGTSTVEFDYVGSEPVSPDARVSIVFSGTSDFVPVTVARLSLCRLESALTGLPPIRRRYVDAYPTTGTWVKDEQAIFTTAALVQTYGSMLVCTASGTFGTLTGVTATSAGTSEVVTVNSSAALKVGDTINIAGATNGPFYINRVNSATSISLNTFPTPAVTGAAMSYATPTFIQSGGAAAGGILKTTQISAFGPSTNSPAGPEQYILTGANKLANPSGELGASAWTVVSGTFATDTSGVGSHGPGFLFDLSTVFEVYQDARVYRSSFPIWFVMSTLAMNGGADLQYQLEELDGSKALIGVLVPWKTVTASASIIQEPMTVTNSAASVTGFIRVRLRSTVAAQKQFMNLGIWHGLPGAQTGGGQASSIRYLYDMAKATTGGSVVSSLVTNAGVDFYNRQIGGGPTRYVTSGSNKLANGNGELGADAWNLVSGTFGPSNGSSGPGRLFDFSTAFEVYQDAAGYMAANMPMYFTLDLLTGAAGSLEYRIDHVDGANVTTTVVDWTAATQGSAGTTREFYPPVTGSATIRVRLRSTVATQKQFRGVGLWAGVPGVSVGPLESLRWLYNYVKANVSAAPAVAVLTSTTNPGYGNSVTGTGGPVRTVTPGTNKLRNASGELGTDAWTMVSGALAGSAGGPGRMFDFVGAFEMYQEVTAYYDVTPLWFTVDTITLSAPLEYRIEHHDGSNALTVLADWTALVAGIGTNKSVMVPAAGSARIRVALRSTAAGQKQFRSVGLWQNSPGLTVGPLESVRWLYENKVGITQAATTATLGLVKRSAALTAPAVPSTPLTASATYTQSEITAIIARNEQMRVRLADLEAKLIAAGILT